MTGRYGFDSYRGLVYRSGAHVSTRNLRMPILILFFAILFPSVTRAEPVVVYAYDSFLGKDSLGALVEAEAAREKIETRFVSFPSAGEALNQLSIEGKNTPADVLVGVDDSLLTRARLTAAFEKIDAAVIRDRQIPKDLWFDSDGFFAPFDYGYVSLVYDDRSKLSLPSPLSLRAVARDNGLHGKLVIEDPRSSSIGLEFLLWTRLLYGSDDWAAFWKDLWGAIGHVAPGWSAAYGLFLQKGADLVVSYTTSPAYHREKEKNDHYHALIFPEGCYRQVEGAAVVKYSKNKLAARKWLGLLLSENAQAGLATRQWMYPARQGVPVPHSFEDLPVPKALQMAPEKIEQGRKEWLRQWVASSLGRG